MKLKKEITQTLITTFQILNKVFENLNLAEVKILIINKKKKINNKNNKKIISNNKLYKKLINQSISIYY